MGRTVLLILLLAVGLQLAECARNRTRGGRKGGKRQMREDIQTMKQQMAQLIRILTKDDCDPNPCARNETCVSRVKNYYCQAATCETEAVTEENACDPNPCRNGGTCTEEDDGYACACRSGFSGDRCEIEASAEFRAILSSENVPSGWHIASYAEVSANLAAAKSAFDGKDGYTCLLIDGQMSGSTYNYNLQQGAPNLQLGGAVITDQPLAGTTNREGTTSNFRAVLKSQTVPAGWRVVSRSEVAANLAAVKGAFAGKNWYICILADGTMSGSGYNYDVSHNVNLQLGGFVITNL